MISAVITTMQEIRFQERLPLVAGVLFRNFPPLGFLSCYCVTPFRQGLAMYHAREFLGLSTDKVECTLRNHVADVTLSAIKPN